MREVLAQNINRLMAQRYKESSNRPLALSKAAGVSLSSVQRTLSRETGATVDTVEAFARVFGLSPYQLLMPGWLGQTAEAPEAEIKAAHGREVRRLEHARRERIPARRRAVR